MTRILVDSLVARRNGNIALAEISLSLGSGEHYALMGPSGSGKTTLLHCLAGLIKPDEGTLTVGDLLVSAQRDRVLRRWRLRHVGLVFQFGDLIPELTIQENIELPSRLLGMPSGEVANRAEDLIRRVGLEAVRAALPSQVSGGQQQRASVARAVLHRPSLILADEPTGAVDSENGRHVMDVLIDTAHDVGATLVVVTHDPDVARRLENLLRISDGRLVA